MIDTRLIIKYLTTLELPFDEIVTEERIHGQVRRLSKVYHPDVASAAFKDGVKFRMLFEAEEYLKQNLDEVNDYLLSSNAGKSCSSPSRSSPPKKICFKCSRKIGASLNVCPHCGQRQYSGISFDELRSVLSQYEWAKLLMKEGTAASLERAIQVLGNFPWFDDSAMLISRCRAKKSEVERIQREKLLQRQKAERERYGRKL